MLSSFIFAVVVVGCSKSSSTQVAKLESPLAKKHALLAGSLIASTSSSTTTTTTSSDDDPFEPDGLDAVSSNTEPTLTTETTELNESPTGSPPDIPESDSVPPNSLPTYYGSSSSSEDEYKIPTLEALPEITLDLPSAISSSLTKNLDVEVKKLDISIAQDVLRQQIGGFNPELSFEGQYEKIRTPQNTEEFISSGGNAVILSSDPRIFTEENWSYELSLEGKLPTGTEYDLFTKQDILRNTLIESGPQQSALSLFSPEYSTFTGMTLTQPLLRNFGTDVNLAEIRVARKNKLISRLELEAAMLETVSETLKAYFDLMYHVRNLKLKELEQDLASELAKEKRELLEKGLVSPGDLNKAEATLAEVIEELVLARNEVFAKQTELQILTTNHPTPNRTSVFIPTTKLIIPHIDLDYNNLVAEAFSSSPAYKIAKRKVEREDIRLVFAENQVWPQLDLKGTYGINGLSPSIGGSYTRSFGGQGSEWSVGAVFSIPLGNDEAIGRKHEAQHRKRQSILELKNLELQTSLAFQQLIAIIESNRERLEAMQLFHANAQRSYEEEEIRLEKGLTTENTLFKFRRDLHKAKVRELAATVDLNKAYIRLFETAGTLLERYNIFISSS